MLLMLYLYACCSLHYCFLQGMVELLTVCFESKGSMLSTVILHPLLFDAAWCEDDGGMYTLRSLQ